MSLIYCRECGLKVSEFAMRCNNCGIPIHNYNKQLQNDDQLKINNSIWVIIGYLIPLLGVFIHPIFALCAFFISCVNILKKNYLHGIVQILLSIICGIIGSFINLLLFIL